MAERTKSPSALSAILGLLVIVGIIVGGLILLDNIQSVPETSDITPTPTPQPSRVSLVLTNMAELPVDKQYAVWGVINSTPLLIGTFKMEGERVVPTLGTHYEDGEFLTATDVSAAGEVYITVEHAATTPSHPTSARYLTSNVEEGIGALSSSLRDLDGFRGEYILASPTDTSDTNETSGVWFMHRNEDGTYSAALSLPELPDGWNYQGWVRHEGRVLTTGTFRQGNMQDGFALYGGDVPGPAFPGEDFLLQAPESFAAAFPLNLTTGETEVFITIEPVLTSAQDQDASSVSGIFQFTVLHTEISEDADENVNYPMDAESLVLPSGIVVIR